MPPKQGTMKVFVDTNLTGDSDAQSRSVMLLESSDTTIGQLKEKVQTHIQSMYQNDGRLAGAMVERLHCLFDANADSQAVHNRYSVPDTYKVGDVAVDGQNSVRIFAEYAGFGQKAKKRGQSVGGGGEVAGGQGGGRGQQDQRKTPVANVSKKTKVVHQQQQQATPAKEKKNVAGGSAPQTGAVNTPAKDKKAAKKERKRKAKLGTPGAPQTTPQTAPQTAPSTKKRKAKKDPNKPKGATSAYIYFSNAKREEVKQHNQDIAGDVREIAKKLGEMWKAMSEDEKKPFHVMAEKDKERYAKEMAEYVPPVAAADDGPASSPAVAPTPIATQPAAGGEAGGEADDEGVHATQSPTSKKRGSSKKDPNKPKRASTAYQLFLKDTSATIMAEHPGLSFQERSQMVAEKWKKMSDEDKHKFDARVEEDKQRYAREMEAYEPQEHDAVSPKKRAKKDPNAPKGATSAYIFFSNSKRQEVKDRNPEIAGEVTQIAKKLGEMWQALSDKDKEPYIEMAEKDKARYAEEKATYEAGKGDDGGTDEVATGAGTKDKASPTKKKVEKKEPAPAKATKSDSSSSSSSSSSSDSDSDSSSSSSSSSSSDSDSSDSSSSDDSDDSDEDAEPAAKAKTSGKFTAPDGPGLSNLLAAAASNDKVSMKSLKSTTLADKKKAEAKQKKNQEAAAEESQWRKPARSFTMADLKKLCRDIVNHAINHERKAQGKDELGPHSLYKGERPSWWPLADFSAKETTKNKENVVNVYEAARKVLAAIYDVSLED